MHQIPVYLKPVRGFTLVELLFVVAIVAILGAVGFPSYESYIIKARRAEAKAMMMRGALWMERNQAASFSYATDAAGVLLTANTLNAVGLGRSPEAASVADASYLITLNTIPAGTFELRATAQNRQATKDVNCAVLVLNHLGQRGRVSSGAPDYTSASAKTCWSQ